MRIDDDSCYPISMYGKTRRTRVSCLTYNSSAPGHQAPVTHARTNVTHEHTNGVLPANRRLSNPGNGVIGEVGFSTTFPVSGRKSGLDATLYGPDERISRGLLQISFWD